MSDFPKARQSRRQFLVSTSVLGVAAGAGLGGLAACGTGSEGGGGSGGGGGGGSAGRSGKPGETLFIAGFQWGPPTHFNPLNPNSPAWPCGRNAMQLVYESLVRFNLLTGELDPGLSTGLEEPDEKTIVAPLQPDATWQDGKPVTAEDVVFTWELAKKHPEVPYAAFWDYVETVEATDEATVTFTLKEPYNPGLVKQNIHNEYVLPKHIWEPIEAKGDPLADYENIDPVGSGPYKIDAYNQQQVGLVRYDGYWGKSAFGGLPKPKYVVHPIFKGNQDGDLQFERGNVDVMQQFTPQIWKMWEDKDLAVSTWHKKEPYHVPGSIPMLVVNTTKKGLDDPQVRRALAFSIDYADIAAKAMSRYSQPANSSVIIPGGGEDGFFDQANVDANGWKYDPDEAVRILEEDLGAKKGDDGIYVLKDGTRLGPWTAQTPTGWTDWQSALRIVAANAKEVGFEIRTKFPQAPNVTSTVQAGDFDLNLWYIAGASAATPWQRFRDVLDDRGVAALGKPAFWNYGRFKDPAVHDLLDKAASATDEAELKDLFTQLDTIYMKNAPMIPLMYRPLEFYEFNEVNWTNFPSEDNDYAPPMFQGAGVSWLFKIKKLS